MKTLFIRVLLIVSFILTLMVGCAPKATTEPIKIGVPAPLTGPYAHDGL